MYLTAKLDQKSVHHVSGVLASDKNHSKLRQFFKVLTKFTSNCWEYFMIQRLFQTAIVELRSHSGRKEGGESKEGWKVFTKISDIMLLSMMVVSINFLRKF